MKLSTILALLDDVRQVERDSWKALCPAHNDRNPSLSVSAGIEKDTVLHCHAGCDFNDITKVLLKRVKKLEEDYYYQDKNKFIIGRVRRVYDDNGNKNFYQQTAEKPNIDPNAIVWKNGSNADFKNTPYRLPEVLEAIKAGRRVFVVEGEKDANRLFSEGEIATCNSQGAGKWSTAHSRALKGCKRVFVIADNDDTGIKHAWKVHDELENIVTKVTVHRSPFTKDISDHLDFGHKLREIEEIDKPAPIHARIVTGSSFVFDSPVEVPAVWGYNGKVVMWAEGQGCMIVAPQGVGKTTLGVLLLEARLGLTTAVLDMPVKATDKSILYMAMDRPDQIASAMRRRFEVYGRSNAELQEQLKVWPGPPEQDFARHPEALTELAHSLNADTIIIDSLKDAVIGLSKEETGQGWNTAVQLCLLNGIQVCILNHPVKKAGFDAKPMALDDVYGSGWITAGLGSVISLWGERTSAFAELTHLKQPAIPIDPLTVQRNGRTGEITVIGKILDWAFFFLHNPKSVSDLAKEMFPNEQSRANYAKAKRQVDDLIGRGIIVKHGKTIGDKGAPADTFIVPEPE